MCQAKVDAKSVKIEKKESRRLNGKITVLCLSFSNGIYIIIVYVW